MSSNRAKSEPPIIMEPPVSAGGPPDHVHFGNPLSGPMQDPAKNARFEEWKRDLARWEFQDIWDRETPKDVVDWRKVKW
ncbi:hypothetical protein PG987_011585 [Apiospora arundinis]